MTHDPKLIGDIEAGKIPLRDLSDRVLVVAGWEIVACEYIESPTGTRYASSLMFCIEPDFDWSDRPHPLALEHDALALNSDEWDFTIGREDGTYTAAIFGADNKGFYVTADTAAKAICLAYLRMKEDE